MAGIRNTERVEAMTECRRCGARINVLTYPYRYIDGRGPFCMRCAKVERIAERVKARREG